MKCLLDKYLKQLSYGETPIGKLQLLKEKLAVILLVHTFSKCSDLSAEYSINISRNSTSFLQSKCASSDDKSLHICSRFVLASAQLEFA